MNENFDILNEFGIYTGEVASREECHKKGLFHKAVLIFIINDKDEILLQRRSKTKKMWPDLLDITAGGHVLSGELGINAIIRETSEELGITLNKNDVNFIGAFISKVENGNIIDNHFNEFYIAKLNIDISKIKLQYDEVSEIKWMSKNEVINRINNNYNGLTAKYGCWEYLINYFRLQ